ncbi:MAG: CpaF family protein [Clostridiales Family XIII bacterium]|jgi:pilus assembly protein CpaF|nr:CpaF family protein [Clostridiales Family XIII bacterium]
MNQAEAVRRITGEIRERINSEMSDKDDEEVREAIVRYVLSHEDVSLLSICEKSEIIDTVYNRVRKDLSILQPFADDREVSEIMVNGRDAIFIEKKGKVYRVGVSFESAEELEEVIRRIAAKVHREINELNPILDARLEDGSRINAVYKNVALNGPSLTIRKFPENRITMEDLLRFGTINKDAADFLRVLVIAGYNIFISGGTSSGKTTFLNVLSNYIPQDERIVVIEDSAELQITEIENIVRLECRNANVQGKGGVTMRHLIKSSLRMRPNRIIVGEVRGEEVLDMIQAMNTGHDGSLSTGHANSPKGMICRLEAMYLQAADFPVEAIRRQISEAIEIIIHLGKTAEGFRKVLEISEVSGMAEGEIVLNPLYRYDAEHELTPTGNRLGNDMKLRRRGLSLVAVKKTGS